MYMKFYYPKLVGSVGFVSEFFLSTFLLSCFESVLFRKLSLCICSESGRTCSFVSDFSDILPFIDIFCKNFRTTL